MSDLAHTPEYTIRQMSPADLGIVRQIDRDAFDMMRRQERRPSHALNLRTLDNMRAALRRPHPGVVIEWPPGRVVGYCFTHVWGSLGWLGTLGIAPRSQGIGLGRAVIAAGLDVLRRAGCRVLALETMPDSGKNLALYTRLGLDPRHLTVLCQGAPPQVTSTHFERWNGDGDSLRQIASGLVPGLDPAPAARWLAEEQAGDTLIWSEGGQPVAFAALRAGPRRDEGFPSSLTVEAAACLPEAAHLWPRYLGEMQTHARNQGKSGLVLPVNTHQAVLLRGLLDAGLRIVHTRVRMATGESLGGPESILLMTLAM
ncbi:MAG: GNAT family N-acetyltransferase [Anaerolineae bacterium]|nr:GNAT family N-acetyltransferase [Anaerolineae bacterium]